MGDGSCGGGDAALVQKNKTRTIEIEEWTTYTVGAAAVARSCALWTCASGTHSWHTESHKGKAEGKEKRRKKRSRRIRSSGIEEVEKGGRC
ncbi:hypothetical protein PV327_004300, partial [Microctonus hyperodae]